MSLWTVLPIRGLESGKSRLAPALDPAARTALSTRLLLHSLDAMEDCFGTLSRCIVISAEAGARDLAADRGAVALCDPPASGLDAALTGARDVARIQGASRLLIVAADIPGIEAGSLRSLLAATSPGHATLVPDKSGTGTNALLFPAATPLAFAFGAGSLARHEAALAALGVPSLRWLDPRLAFDVDTPEDLAAWQSQGSREGLAYACVQPPAAQGSDARDR